jgi:hypothetical protein
MYRKAEFLIPRGLVDIHDRLQEIVKNLERR